VSTTYARGPRLATRFAGPLGETTARATGGWAAAATELVLFRSTGRPDETVASALRSLLTRAEAAAPVGVVDAMAAALLERLDAREVSS
jgi:hypothetical protein